MVVSILIWLKKLYWLIKSIVLWGHVVLYYNYYFASVNALCI
jgi:hypothetical protein